jgi:hypothetical protein
MRTLSKLINALAAVDDRDPESLEFALQGLIANGIIGKGEMSAQDAANAVIGLNCARRAADTPATVAAFRALKPRLISGGDSERYLPDAVLDASDFGETLDALVLAAPQVQETLRTFIGQAMFETPATVSDHLAPRIYPTVTLQVQFHTGPYFAAALRVEAMRTCRAPYGRRETKRTVLHETIFTPWVGEHVDNGESDRRVSVVLGVKTFLALNVALTRPAALAAAGSVLAFPASAAAGNH